MKVLVAGASGFIGTRLTAHLRGLGHEVTRLVRHPSSGPDESTWDPAAGQVNQAVVAGSDVVVNLSGAPIARFPWTSAYRAEILGSRVSATRTLARAIAASEDPPALLSGSGTNAYGDDRGGEVLAETSSSGDGFLASVVREWEDEAAAASEAGARVCFLRTSVVLDADGGTLKLISLPFKLGVGGRIGSGEQYFPCISMTDWLRATTFLATTPGASGAYNLAAPHPPTNRELTKALGAALHRPTFVPVPAAPVKLLLRDQSALLLGSLRVVPARLGDAGFTFEHPDVTSMLASALA